ncbi:MAG: response regulator transcription factor [Brevefilum sp.]|nr:response regulator transcription factor [Brevefilum sp.]
MTQNDPIRVMIVDDHKMVRSGLSAFLVAYDDLALVAEAESGERAVALCHHAQPDVVLMDLVMPKMNGAEATEAILKSCPDMKVIALTSYKDQALVEGALKAGAIGYLLKNVEADDLAKAIRQAYAGQPTLAPEAAQVLIQASRQPYKPGIDLTQREKEVLALLVEGRTNPEIAENLVVTKSTVKFHVSSILHKLQVSTRTEAVAKALQEGLLDQ